MDITKSLLFLILIVITIFLCLYAHSFYKDYLRRLSMETIIPQLQTMPDWTFEILKWVSWFSDDGIFVWLLGFYAFFNRAASLYLFTVSGLIGVIIEQTKVMFSEGRPFYMDSN